MRIVISVNAHVVRDALPKTAQKIRTSQLVSRLIEQRLTETECQAFIRLVPYSYFCTCWTVRPIAAPSTLWLMPSIIRSMRMRLLIATHRALCGELIG